MQIPQLCGTIQASDFVVYSACDTEYFDQFAQVFARSAQRCAGVPVHLHIFNPRLDQLAWCDAHNIGTTWEYVDPSVFAPAASQLLTTGGEGLRRTQVAIAKSNDINIVTRMAKTYYACARFIRLVEVHSRCATVFACDVDAVIRKPIPRLSPEVDVYIHQIFGNKARFLAGGLYLCPGAQEFLQAYRSVLQSKIEQDILYWSVDQDVLDPLMPRFNYGQLPETMIDWNMRPDSVVWTAKGARKNNSAFTAEQKLYSV